MTRRETLRSQLPSRAPNERVDLIFEFMERRGSSHYDEEVTQLEHALQCAQLASESDSGASAITAALFHDLGHLLLDEHSDNEGSADKDSNHEEYGAKFLAPYFPPEVTEPVRLHVPAKRYLCTTDATYYETLSDTSKHSFRLQGGALSDAERAAFEKHPQLERALQLRRWDDLAKLTDHVAPALEAYRGDVLAAMREED